MNRIQVITQNVNKYGVPGERILAPLSRRNGRGVGGEGIYLRLLHLLLALALLVACGASDPPITAVSAPSGWQSIKGSSFVVALPPDWEVVNAQDADYTSALNDLVRDNPRLATVANQTRQAFDSGQLKLLAFDLSADSAAEPFTPSFSVGEQPDTSGAALDDIADANAAQLRDNGFIDIEVRSETINNQPMVHLQSTNQITVADQTSLRLAYSQWITIHQQRQYILTFTASADHIPRVEPISKQILSTFQVVEP